MPLVEISTDKGLVQKSGAATDGGAGLKLLALNGAAAELKVIQADVTIADGAVGSKGKSSAAIVPAGFVALSCHVRFTVASTGNVNLVDIGTEADPDCFVDGAGLLDLRTIGDKGFVSCNGLAAVNGAAATTGRALEAEADELSVTLSGDPGAGNATVRVTLVGLVLTQATV